MYKKIICFIVLVILVTGCSSNNQPIDNDIIDNDITKQAINADADDYVDLYKPVIDAYIALEQSDYTLVDKSILSDDVCLTPNGGGSYFFNYYTKPTLMYTFYDLNSNGTPELLIGAELGGTTSSNVFITGIYGLKDGKPISLIQVGGWSQLAVLTDISGKCIIEVTSGTHIDYVAECFYKIDKNETLITLDKLYTYGKFNDHNKPDDITYKHTKDDNGEEASITEQEYHALMQKYGSVGYLNTAGDLKANEVVMNSWKPLTAYK